VAEHDEKLADDAQLLREAEAAGGLTKYGAYLRLSGPGWLQSAITLGGGTLASSLYLGVLGGYDLLWLQPVAMLFGIVMLSAIGYVTLTTGLHPFQAVRDHINPVLAWGWALAALVASMVWVLPQYSLATGVLQQNLMPGLLGPEGPFGEFGSKFLIAGTILVLSTIITWNYGAGGWGVKLYEFMVKLMVALIVICFVGVILSLAMSPQGLAWGQIFRGFIPNPALAWTPSSGFQALLETITPEHRGYWESHVVRNQRDIMVSAAAVAVGINMTFLFGYSLLKRNWGKEFRGFLKFDLGTGMLIPFMIVTSCVVVAAASQFHTIPQPGFDPGDEAAHEIPRSPRHEAQLRGLLAGRVAYEIGEEAAAPLLTEEGADEMNALIATLPESDHFVAATLITRDAFDLAISLEPFTGEFFAHYIFGLGVLGMTLSSITLLMLISGIVVCELLKLPHTGWPLRLGSLAAATGALGPFVWAQAYFWLVVPTSVFGFMLIPIAYLIFFLMMNQRKLLGVEAPTGARLIAWNTLMGIAVVLTSVGSIFMVWDRAGWYGIAAVAAFLGAAAVAHVLRPPHSRPQE